MEGMHKAAKLQTQVKENNSDLVDFLNDLTRWEESVKSEDKHLKNERKFKENLPPVRSVKSEATKKDENSSRQIDQQTSDGKKARISSYDYDAWSKFDVDAACKGVDDSVEESVVSEEDEEEEDIDNEELDKIRQQKAVQKAILEKEKGNQLFKEGKFDAAINRYTSAINLHPQNPVLYANRGMALLKKEHYAAAEADCDVALQLDPKYGKAIARRATARKKLRKYDLALEDFNLLLKVEPKNLQATTEIKEIESLKAKQSKDMNKAGGSNLDVKPVSHNLQNGNRIPEKGRMERSNKPLKRILITEVGIDENGSQKTRKPVVGKSDDAFQQKEVSEKVEGTPIFHAPSSSFAFEKELKTIKNNGEHLYKYLKLIPVSDYGKLFLCIDTLISPFINTLKNYYMRDNIHYHDEMDSLTTVPRFDMAAMFLSRKDRELVKDLLKNMSDKSYQEEVPKLTIKKLGEKYGVHL